MKIKITSTETYWNIVFSLEDWECTSIIPLSSYLIPEFKMPNLTIKEFYDKAFNDLTRLTSFYREALYLTEVFRFRFFKCIDENKEFVVDENKDYSKRELLEFLQQF
jgi:hypothetical protein